MLELKNIVKDYPAGDGVVNALRGINLRFRNSEFVSILGQSGCGKTTMLNIIGGLDRFTSGDLVINGVSTKDYRDRDWDTYRNHSVGFVFQSYNLIPHQTVLGNVELALTLSGVGKAERRRRAIKALEDVGLGNQLNKKPCEMSGGQMQRVAIARALVNDPDIILADEPTGALDTETSVQVMEILKKISSDRLIIMVTHNPELAYKYSSRIIKMLDGRITDDSAPLDEAEYEKYKKADKEERAKSEKTKKPSMSFATSFMLSLRNLFTKKGRTILTSFAGSIGIIGIALIVAISNGMTDYINVTQENALSSYPLTIEKTTVDLSSLLNTFMNVSEGEIDHDRDAVYKRSVIYDVVNAMNTLEVQENDLAAFKKYLDGELEKSAEDGGLSSSVSGVSYSYSLPLLVYTKNPGGEIIRSDTEAVMAEMMPGMARGMSSSSSSSQSSSMGGMGAMSSMMYSGMWQEMLPGKDGSLVSDLIYSQYDLVYGSYPNDYNEAVLVLDENNELDDLTLYALGLETREEVEEIMDAAMNGEEVTAGDSSWSYADAVGGEYRVILNSSVYKYDEETGLYTDLRESDAGMRYLYDNGLKIKITGVIRKNEDAVTGMLTGSVAYTSALSEYIRSQSAESDAIKAQRDDPERDILTGLPFKPEHTLSPEEKADEFLSYASSLGDEEKSELYIKMKSTPSDEEVASTVDGMLAGMTREMMEAQMIPSMAAQTGMSESEIGAYIGTMSDDDIRGMLREAAEEQVRESYADGVRASLSEMSSEELTAALEDALKSSETDVLAGFYDSVMEFSPSDYETNLKTLGYVDEASPSAINIYASTFADKDKIEDAIAEYNKGVDEVSAIKYTDYVGIMMSSVTTIINAITYVLIAFVAISLIVSSIMIGVITLISVQERTKEIGILRAIGASKKDVSGMFNAETVIIGFTAGLLGVAVTYILCLPINALIHHLTGIMTLSAALPLSAAVILILISVLLTLISGIIPSRSAAKKDPVVALRDAG